MGAHATAALTPQAEICSQFDEDECSGSCAYGMLVLGGGDYDYGRKKFRKLLQDDGRTCFVSPAKAQSLLIADGADPFIKGFLGYAFAAGFTCPFETTEAACTAISAPRCSGHGTCGTSAGGSAACVCEGARFGATYAELQAAAEQSAVQERLQQKKLQD